MGVRLHGVTVSLVTKTQDGTDPFGAPIWKETTTEVKNVLVGQPTADDVNDALQIYGKHAKYMLGIPKGDTHTWTDTDVILPAPFAGRYHTIGYPVAGIEDLVPLSWNAKIAVEIYG